MDTIRSQTNPIAGIQADFGAYAEKMKRKDDAHRINGIPDYAFSMDWRLREQIRKLPCFYALSKRVAVHDEARQRQVKTASALQVGPNQFPEIYEMALDCAKRLGIGPPNVFVQHDQTMNAYTFASDTATPIVVLHSGIVERLTPGELKCVIGHECGHIHNEHSVYMSIVNLIAGALNSGGLGAALAAMLTQATLLLFYEWNRAAEVTCDRAGMICADNLEDAISVNKKLLYGTFLNREDNVNIDDIRSQFSNIAAATSVFTEMANDHPSSIRRVLTSEEFTHCELLYRWRPDLLQPGLELRSKEECDKACEKYTAVFKEARKAVG